MLISTRGRYALRVMLELARDTSGEYLPLPVLAARQDISEKYLEGIVSALVKAGLLEGQRGKRGGYRLARAPENCSVGEILRLTEGSLAPVACLEATENTCPRAPTCPTLPVWQRLDTLITDYLEGITLGELLKEKSDVPHKE